MRPRTLAHGGAIARSADRNRALLVVRNERDRGGPRARVRSGAPGGAGVNEPPWLPFALAWDDRWPDRLGIVPVRDDGPGQLVPMIRWQEDGPLLGAGRIRSFASAHPEAAGFAIVLDNSRWGGPRLGCIDDDSGKHDPGQLARPRPLGGYRESTRSGGTHDLFLYGTSLPPGTPSRVTGLGGFVDVLVGDLMYAAPTVNRGRGEYRVVVGLDVPIPEFDAVGLALDSAAPWLRDAWRAAIRGSPTAGPGAAVRADRRPIPSDAAEVLVRMKESGRAGELAAWIAEHTTGDSRDFALCFALAGHAAAAGADASQVREIVSCPHPEWAPGPTLDRMIARLRTRPPAGVAALLRYAEGKAADTACREPTALEVRLRRYATLPWRRTRDILGEEL